MKYEIKGDNVIINKDDFIEEREIQYINFILGYDLLNDKFKKSKCNECDVIYDFCDYLSRKFIKSEEYQNTKYSTYEMLVSWVEKNKKNINKEYNEFIGVEKTKEKELDR